MDSPMKKIANPIKALQIPSLNIGFSGFIILPIIRNIAAPIINFRKSWINIFLMSFIVMMLLICFFLLAATCGAKCSCRFSVISCQISDKFTKRDKFKYLTTRQLHLALVVCSAFSLSFFPFRSVLSRKVLFLNIIYE